MKQKIIRLFCLLCLLFLTGCTSANAQEAKFDQDTTRGAELHAKEYSLRSYELGKIPLHTYVKFSGKILKKDTTGRVIRKDDRFIIAKDQVKVQVISQVDTNCQIGDQVTVYGEYYGFIKGINIMKSTSNN